MGGLMQRMRDERGVSAVVVGISLVALFGAALLSVDAGTLFTARRGMVTATDTAALSGARAAVGTLTGGNCTTDVRNEVLSRLQEQQPDATLVACTLNPVPSSLGKAGYITVDARRAVELKFGGVLGLGAQSAFSSTSVQYGYPTGAGGLRPIGICIDNPHIQEWLVYKALLSDGDLTNDSAAELAYNLHEGTLDHPSYDTQFPGAGVVHRIYFNTDNAQDCGGSAAAGNWGWMDFNGGSNTNTDTREWLRNGYPGDVAVHVPVPACDTHDPDDGCLNGTTGDKGNAMNTELAHLTNNEIHFYIPIFEYGLDVGNTVVFTIKAFVGAIMRGYQHGANGYFDIEFYDAILQGGCCSSTGISTGAVATKICAVDHDDESEAARCS